MDYRDLLKRYLRTVNVPEKDASPFSEAESAEIERLIDENRKEATAAVGMSPQKALDLLQAVNLTEMDEEDGHRMGDTIICAMLEGLGYVDIVIEYRKIPKSYD